MVYQRKIVFNSHSNEEFGLIVCAIDPDNGETDSYLTIESVYTENFNGTKRYDYGAKYTEPAMLYITMVKNNYADFSKRELREVLNWLTGLRKTSWMDLYGDNTGDISFSFLGRVTDVKLYKMDARVVSIKVEFTSISPWAYSKINRTEATLDGSGQMFAISNESDEDSEYVYPNIMFVNKYRDENGNTDVSGTLAIINHATGDKTEVRNLAFGEVIMIDSNKTIYSRPNLDSAIVPKIFGDDFSFEWIKLAPGYNHLEITGVGHIIIDHRDYLKVADAYDDCDDLNMEPFRKNSLLLTSVELLRDNWVRKDTDEFSMPVYTQNVDLPATKMSRVNLQADAQQTLDLQAKNIEIQIINDDGLLTAYSYGDVPSDDLVFQATIEETDKEISKIYEEITLYKNCWYGCGNVYYQPVYIRNLGDNSIVDFDLTDLQLAVIEGYESTMFIKNVGGKATVYSLGFKPEDDCTVGVVITNTVKLEDERYQWNDGFTFAEPLSF